MLSRKHLKHWTCDTALMGECEMGRNYEYVACIKKLRWCEFGGVSETLWIRGSKDELIVRKWEWLIHTVGPLYLLLMTC